jgi:segregation and condensation protein A
MSAGLELVKDGALEARQLEAFADIYLRARKEKAA